MSKRNLWTIDDSKRLYNLNRWSKGFFSIDPQGDMTARTGPDQPPGRSIPDVVRQCEELGAAAPVLIRFMPVIRQRLIDINRAFQQAIDEFHYSGSYTCVYPVKVNQHREVIDAFVNASEQFGGGLESGSKAELLAVITLAKPNMPILCNGFKDETIVEMALRGILLGKDITIIIEKPQEVELIERLSRKLNVKPKLGVRVKLAARSAGRWKTSVGSRSKFGLSASELGPTIQRIREIGLIDHCHLLHFHPGSQINNVRNIKSCIFEATRIFADLVQMGVPLRTIDVGGGLAVDYTGNQNLQPSSMNYTLQEYANDVVYYIRMICDQENIEHPNVISESGRALVAHHSMLVVPVIGKTASEPVPLDPAILKSDVLPLIELREILNELELRNLSESYHDAQHALEMAQQLFINGHLSIEERAGAETLFSSVCLRIHGMLNDLEFIPAELAELRTLLSDTYLANFSVFQSLPDYWALQHVFPMMPIHRLDEKPDCYAVVGDITCDSDGMIDCFIGQDESARAIPLHKLNADMAYWIGFFLIGAYQEALSDDHNLMGKFHTAIVDWDPESPDDEYRLILARGSDLREVLEHVNHDYASMIERIEDSVEQATAKNLLDPETAAETIEFFRECGEQYTYLKKAKFIDSMSPAADDQDGEQATELTAFP